MQHSSQNIVVGQSDIGQSHVEADNRTAIHFIVLTVPAVNLDDGGFVTIGIGICGRATECLGPISGESLDVLGVEAMAERMGHDVVGHYAIMPGVSKTAKAFVATRCLKDGLHVPMMTILSRLCKILTPAASRIATSRGALNMAPESARSVAYIAPSTIGGHGMLFGFISVPGAHV